MSLTANVGHGRHGLRRQKRPSSRCFNREADARALLAESARNAAYRRISVPKGGSVRLDKEPGCPWK